MSLKLKAPGPNAESAPPPPAEPQVPAAEREPAAVPVEPKEVPSPEAARLAYIRAFAAAKAEFEPVKKTRPIYERKDGRLVTARDGTPKVRYYHADLTDVMASTDTSLSRHGLFHRIDAARTEDGGLRYTVTMTHIDGHSEQGVWDLGPDDLRPGEGATKSKMTAIQSRGVVDTYARRYALQNFLGVAAEEDPDGQTELEPEKPAADPKAAAIFAGAVTPAVAPTPEPAATKSAAIPPAAPVAPRAEPKPEPAATVSEPEAVAAEPEAPADPAAQTLAAHKRELTELLVNNLTEAGLPNSRENILALLDASCAQVGVTRADLDDSDTVESLIALQRVSPVDPATLELQVA